MKFIKILFICMICLILSACNQSEETGLNQIKDDFISYVEKKITFYTMLIMLKIQNLQILKLLKD